MHSVTRQFLGPLAERVVYPAIGKKKELQTDMVLDEQIWGNRLRSEQSPWFTFLEFLTILEYRLGKQSLLDPKAGQSSPLRYEPRTSLVLRILLFNEQRALELVQDNGNDDACWDKWLKHMADRDLVDQPHDFSHLRKGLGKFSDFARTLKLLRTAIVDQDGKRWTSRFLFPFGKSSVYEDLGIAHGQFHRNYIYFGHTGEVLYLMICRSRHRETLARFFREYLDRGDTCDELVRKLQPGSSRAKRGGGYLPYHHHTVFDELGEDWLRIWELKSMPEKDKLMHLANLAAFHLMRYQNLVSATVLGLPRPSMVCEIVAPRMTPLRRLSIRSFEGNKELSTKAIGAYLDAIEDHTRRSESISKCSASIGEIVGWHRRGEPPTDSIKLLAELRDAAHERHKKRSAGVQRMYGKRVGLVSKRGTNRFRYAPSDTFLRMLVVANVAEHMEFGEFLNTIWERYGVVVGPKEAEQALEGKEYDRAHFRENARRLEDRLRSLGLLHRLSDACAYVQNPFS